MIFHHTGMKSDNVQSLYVIGARSTALDLIGKAESDTRMRSNSLDLIPVIKSDCTLLDLSPIK